MDNLIIGCGYLGRRVAQRWLARGDRVWAVTRSAEHAREFRQLGMQPIICDVFDPEGLRGLPRMDTVLFSVGFDRRAQRSMREVHIEGLRKVQQALAQPRQRFISISSTGVYGQSHEEEVDEDSATEPAEESGQVMLEAEQILQRDSLGPVAILRFAGIYGPGRLLRRAAIEAGEPLVGDPDKWLNLIHVEDGADAVLAVESRCQKDFRVYNICDDHPVRRRDFYTRLAQLMRAPPPRFEALMPGAPLPPHERSNRRVLNRRLREELSVSLQYACYEQGLSASL